MHICAHYNLVKKLLSLGGNVSIIVYVQQTIVTVQCEPSQSRDGSLTSQFIRIILFAERHRSLKRQFV